jgi:hypothetical protein
VPIGKWGYGGGGDKGSWTIAPGQLFNGLLSLGNAGVINAKGSWNSGNSSARNAGEFLCTMSLDAGDLEACTQDDPLPTQTSSNDIPRFGPGNGGMGLQYTNDKIIYHPGEFDPFRIGSGFISFGDMNAQNVRGDQPIISSGRFDQILEEIQVGPDGEFILEKRQQVPDQTSSQYPNWYEALWVSGWEIEPGYLVGPNSPLAYYWPVIPLNELVCSDGTFVNQTLNPAGAPTLCDEDFDVWYADQVPAAPPQLSTVADTTVYRDFPNLNDGLNPFLSLNGSRQLVVIGFDAAEMEAFLEENEFESARLVLSTADTAERGTDRTLRLRVSPLEYGSLVEGNGSTAEGGSLGSGSGATWECAEDADISDTEGSCVQYWPRKLGKGGPGTNVKLPAGFGGRISIEVTDDVKNGVFAWTIRELNKLGGAAFVSSQGAEELDRPELAPTLILHTASDGG